MKKVSVIIPSYNAALYLDETIRSVLNQTYRDLEIIIVDDASTDNTGEVLEKYLDDPRMKCIRNQKNSGLSFSRNAGIAASEGNLIAFLDADDIYLPEKLEKQIKCFDKNRYSLISYTNAIYFKDNENKDVLSTRYHFSGDVFYFLKRSNFIAVSTVMLEREMFKKYKFNENLSAMGHGDWEFYLRLSRDGIKFVYIEKALSKIRVRKNAMTSTDGMTASRNEVGLVARRYWKEFKRSMKLSGASGRKAIFRYTTMKTKAFLMNFPKRSIFNKPAPQELL